MLHTNQENKCKAFFFFFTLTNKDYLLGVRDCIPFLLIKSVDSYFTKTVLYLNNISIMYSWYFESSHEADLHVL